MNVWGCFTAQGVGYQHTFSENLDADGLIKIYQSHMLPSALGYFPHGQWHLLQDNDPRHRSDKAYIWLHNHGVSRVKFPPYSPDLNPIENLWADMARRVESHHCTTLYELEDAIALEWDSTDKKLLQKLVASMPKRCKAVIESEGHFTTF